MRNHVTLICLAALTIATPTFAQVVDIHGRHDLVPIISKLETGRDSVFKISGAVLSAGFKALCSTPDGSIVVVSNRPPNSSEMQTCQASNIKLVQQEVDDPNVGKVLLFTNAARLATHDNLKAVWVKLAAAPTSAELAKGLIRTEGAPVHIKELGLTVERVTIPSGLPVRLSEHARTGKAMRIVKVESSGPFHPTFTPGLIVLGGFEDGDVTTPDHLIERLERAKNSGTNHIVSLVVFVPRSANSATVFDYELGTKGRTGGIDTEQVKFIGKCIFEKKSDC